MILIVSFSSKDGQVNGIEIHMTYIIQPSNAIHGLESDYAIYHEKTDIEMPQTYSGSNSNLIFFFFNLRFF